LKARKIERSKFGEKLHEENEKGTVFRVAKQIVRINRDIVGGGSVKVTNGRIVVDEHQVMETWRLQYKNFPTKCFLECYD